MSASGGNLLSGLDYSVLQQCMHCGLCLPVCPTFVLTRRERHGPRGRIAAMRAIADGEAEVDAEFAKEISFCLGCLACTSACPAGVDYGTLVETARAEVERRGILDTPSRKAVRSMTLHWLFLRPERLRQAGWALRLWNRSGARGLFRALQGPRVLPEKVRAWEASTPEVARAFSDERIAVVERPKGAVRGRVLLLTGCMQDLLLPGINRATADVLLENGFEVHTPRAQHCCGSLHAHNGDLDSAKLLARRHLEGVEPRDYEAILSNAGGCGSHLRHYGALLEGEAEWSERASAWDARVRDVHEFLVEVGFRSPRVSGLAEGTRVTYHDSCHLMHGQKVTQQPRQILRSLPAIVFAEAAEAGWCCGSAGVYSLTQPETAEWLLERRRGHLLATRPDVVATANPGCHLQLQRGFTEAGVPAPRVVHPVVLLAEAYRAEGCLGIS